MPAADVPLTSAALRQRAADIVVTLREYRASLEKLLAIYEASLAKAKDQRDQRQEFLNRGIISRREFEDAERAVTEAQAKVDGTRREIAGADHAMAEATTARALASLSPLKRGGYEQTAVLIRFNGPASWSLKAGTAKLQEFFTATTGWASTTATRSTSPSIRTASRAGWSWTTCVRPAFPSSPPGAPSPARPQGRTSTWASPPHAS